MTPRLRIVIVLALAVVGGMVAVLAVQHRRHARGAGSRRALTDLHEAHDRFRARLEELLKADPLVNHVEAVRGNVILGVRSAFAKSLMQELAAKYLERVTLELEGITIDKEGELKTDTPLGRITAGQWKVILTIHRVRGVLRAGSPRVEFRGTNRVAVAMPVRIESGQGEATVAFGWKSKPLAQLVCRDFQVIETITGRVLSGEYSLDGAFVLLASGERLTARPEFPDRKFRLEVEPAPETWAQVRRALEKQDTWEKCGLAMDPAAVVGKLRELVAKGFDVKLPRKLYRPVSFPAAFRQDVMVEGQPVELAVTVDDLSVTSDVIWYSAAVRSRMTPATGRSPSRPGTASSP